MPLAPRATVAFVLLASLSLPGGLAACGGGPAPPTADPASLRSLPGGDVVGFTGAYGSHVWKGLPYAAPPVGPARWRAPRPAPAWTGVRQALATGEACPQFASVFSGEGRGASGVMGDEDCLYLDVYAPVHTPGAVPSGDDRLPVLFWIHGGGNSIGRAGFYDGGNLAATHDVVVVALNYRMGPFGWLRHRALRGDGTTPAEQSGNFGYLDMLRALEWVQENIAAFGGDPDNVTIFGESAGGRNVVSLLVSPLADGLFHRAMVQSGGLGHSTLAEAEHFEDDPEPGHPHSSNEIVARLLVRDGTAPDRAAARAHLASLSDADVEAYLRGKTPTEILEAYVDDEGGMEGMLFFPQVFHDGTVLPVDETTELLARGDYHRVPIILGTNRDENKLFMAFDPELASWRLGLFPVAHDADAYDAHSDALARSWKARAVDAPAATLRRVQGPSVFAYRWDWDEEPGLPFLYDGSRMMGAAHGLEVAFFFGHFDLGPDSKLLFNGGNREGREALSDQMMSYLAEFAYTGSPGRGREGELVEWTAWDDSDPSADKFIVLDTPSDGGLTLSSETWTVDDVVRATVTDERLGNARARCAVVRQMVDWGQVTPEQYASAGGATCAGYALEDYPWVEEVAGS